MPIHRSQLLPVLALAVLSPSARAESTTTLRHLDVDSPHRVVVHGDDNGVKEPVTFLGVETAPITRTLSAQLGLPKDTGLVVMNVVDKSPASDGLKDDDVLTRLDDQVLIDTHQLSVLVRSKKEGDEVKLTVVRGGKEMSVKVKLTTRQVPKHANAFYFRNGDLGGPGINMLLQSDDAHGTASWHGLPGMGPEDSQDVLRMIEHERGNFLVGPGVRIVRRAGEGSTIVDLPKSNISYSDDDGSIEIKVDDGKRNLTVKNAKGEVTFSGPVNTAEERAKLPPDISKQLAKVEGDTFNFEVGEDFRPETVPLLPPPEKTKISHRIERRAARPPAVVAGPF
jgi:serine protease Do